jgi:hypothetical protein
MKKLAHKTGYSLTLLLFLFGFTATAERSGTEKSKEVKETHVITSKHKILIDNRFGEVNITSWEKSEITIDVQIRVKDGNERRAQELIDRIKIDIVKTDNKIAIKTIIEGGDKDLEIKIKNDGYLKIDYNLQIPAANLLEIKNSFGLVTIDRMDASVKVDLRFGAATIGSLNGDENDLNFEFCDPAVVSKFSKGKINLKFSKLELLESEDLILTHSMSESKIDKATKVACHLKFGSLDIKEVEELAIESQMSAVKIESLLSSGDITNKYGALNIAEVLPSVKSLTIDGQFSPIKINLSARGSYKVIAEAKMSGLKLPSGSIMEEQIFEPNQPAIKTTNNFKGRIGEKREHPTLLNLTSSFGEIKILLED